MNKFICLIFISTLIIFSCNESIVDTPQNINGVPGMDILIDQNDYIALLSNKIIDFEASCRCSYEGNLYEGIISSSGAGSKYADRWSYKIKLTKGGLIEGLNEFNLSSQIYDPSALHTVLVSHIYRQLGFPVFFSKHVFVKINGKDQGLYPMIERVEEDFFITRNLKTAELFKLGFNSKFTFTETNNVQFFFEKKIPDDNNFNSLNEFIYACDTSSVENIE